MIFCGSGATAAIEQADRHPGAAHPGRAGRAVPALPAHPGGASARWSSSARTSITPTSCPGASRSPTSWSSARTPTATSTWPTWDASWSATRAAAADRQLLRRLQRHRHPHRHQRGRRRCCTPTARCRSGTTPPPGRTCRSGSRRPRPDAGDHKDAVFLSPHKFLGGPQTPGVLVVRRDLVRNPVPTAPGGGTVAFVDPAEHRYLDDPVAREEGGTPAIIESIRAGLVFAPQAGGRHRPDRRPRGAAVAPRAAPLGGQPRRSRSSAATRRRRLSIVSFLIRHGGPLPAPQLRRRAAERPVRDPGPRRLLLRGPVRAPAARHRPGPFACASREEIGHGCDGVKPGWVRVNFNYFISGRRGRLHRGRGRADGGGRLPAAARLPVRPAHRAVAPRRRPPRPLLRLSDVCYGPDGEMDYPRCRAPRRRRRLPWLSAAGPRAAGRRPAASGRADRARRPTSRRCAGSRCRPPA